MRTLPSGYLSILRMRPRAAAVERGGLGALVLGVLLRHEREHAVARERVLTSFTRRHGR
jgi:hypothetical protein